MAKKYPAYMLVTEEGVEVIGTSSLQVLTEYLELSEDVDAAVDKLIDGKSEIVGIMKKTKEEYMKWLSEAIET